MTDKKVKADKKQVSAKPEQKKDPKPAAKVAAKTAKSTKAEPVKKLINAQIKTIAARVVENTDKKPAQPAVKTKPQAKAVAAKKPAPVKKPVPQVQIKPKQVKDLTEKAEEVMDPKSVLEQLLKEAPVQDLMKAAGASRDSAEPPMIQKQETGFKNVYQTHVDTDTGLGGNRTYSQPPVEKKLSFVDTLAKRSQAKPRPSFNFPKIR